MRKLTFAALLIGLSAEAAHGCPVCDSDTGREVRGAIFGPDFLSTLLAVAAPFPATAAIIGVFHWATKVFPGRCKPDEI